MDASHVQGSIAHSRELKNFPGPEILEPAVGASSISQSQSTQSFTNRHGPQEQVVQLRRLVVV